MKNSNYSQFPSLWLAALIAIFAIGCSSASDPEPINEEELITTVVLTFTNEADVNDVVVATFQDLDGPGGNDATVTNPTLSAFTTYTIDVEFLDESQTPAEDITTEVSAEAEEHQVFLVPSAGLNFTFTYGDQDGNGFPVGLSGSVETGGANTGTLNVVLVHQPNKSAAGVSTGNLANAGGDEDINVNFTVTIQ